MEDQTASPLPTSSCLQTIHAAVLYCNCKERKLASENRADRPESLRRKACVGEPSVFLPLLSLHFIFNRSDLGRRTEAIEFSVTLDYVYRVFPVTFKLQILNVRLCKIFELLNNDRSTCIWKLSTLCSPRVVGKLTKRP